VRAQSKHGCETNRLSVHFGRLLWRMGIRNGDFHTLWHTVASYQAMADTDLWTLQLALGHASHRTGITKRVRFGRLPDAPAVIPFPREGVRQRRWGNRGASWLKFHMPWA
jgi:hypothetical protein